MKKNKQKKGKKEKKNKMKKKKKEKENEEEEWRAWRWKGGGKQQGLWLPTAECHSCRLQDLNNTFIRLCSKKSKDNNNKII